MLTDKMDVIASLRQDILRLQGFKPNNMDDEVGLGKIEQAFPNRIFPRGAIHEFVSETKVEYAATFGFVSGLLSRLVSGSKPCLWICQSRVFFPLSISRFNLAPTQIIFINAPRPQDALWAFEEGLKCNGLSAIVAEIPRISFSESRRLQLAVEKSKVTGLLLRSTKYQNTTTSVARWHIKPLPSLSDDGLPGVGYPQWNVELSKVKNGRPGAWLVAWRPAGFTVTEHSKTITEQIPLVSKAG
ncbi:ImuA family protein [[Flexibacter] sp. ATCC 35208]|uniref:ImuA family protein n=1 Tax=[Flexibacter] sp. ATCC 35208 TaxID=1936242 RepID=UPI0011810C0F|nr:Error-prone repair protein ImuA [[Flexibacter] sp. ATCC 35208]